MKKILLLIAIPLMLYSCTNDDLENTGSQIIDQNKLSQYDVVLQARSSDLPDKWVRPTPKNIAKSMTRGAGANDFMPDDYLGHSYKVASGNGIVGDQDNTGFRVLNIALLQAGRNASYVSNKGYNESYNEAFSYTNTNNYYEKETKTKRIKSGFELNLKLFKIGHTNKITKTFIKEQTLISNAIYGEVNAYVATGKHTLNTTTAALNKISSEYLDPSFMEDLYYSPMSDILKNYGECVLTGYYTGGSAHGLYIGSYKSNKDLQTNEKDMDTNLYASFSWGGATPVEPDKTPTSPTTKTADPKPGTGTPGSVGGNFGFGKGYSRTVIKEKEVQDLFFSVKAVGGTGVGIANTNPAKVENAYISLDTWAASLSTPNSQKLIEILQDGLVGLNTFILEENFKARFGDTYNDLTPSNEFLKPRIEIVRIPARLSASKEQLYDIVAALYTRQGDMFILQNKNVDTATDVELKGNSNEATFIAKSKTIAAEKAKIYKGIGITSNFQKIINPRFRYPLNFRLKGINEGRMYKYYNTDTEMWYMYDMDSAIALAFWFDDYILRYYGLTEWFENLPEKPIKMVSLSNNFKIYGL